MLQGELRITGTISLEESNISCSMVPIQYPKVGEIWYWKPDNTLPTSMPYYVFIHDDHPIKNTFMCKMIGTDIPPRATEFNKYNMKFWNKIC